MTRRRKPVIRVFRRDTGWVMPDFTDLHQCATNHQRQQDGRPACTATAAWRVVEDHGMHLSIGFYCDADLPAEHKAQAGVVRMSHYVSITCDVEDTDFGPCMSEDSGLGAPKTATQARRRIRGSGWHRTRDGRDICPGCWTDGKR